MINPSTFKNVFIPMSPNLTNNCNPNTSLYNIDINKPHLQTNFHSQLPLVQTPKESILVSLELLKENSLGNFLVRSSLPMQISFQNLTSFMFPMPTQSSHQNSFPTSLNPKPPLDLSTIKTPYKYSFVLLDFSNLHKLSFSNIKRQINFLNNATLNNPRSRIPRPPTSRGS